MKRNLEKVVSFKKDKGLRLIKDKSVLVSILKIWKFGSLLSKFKKEFQQRSDIVLIINLYIILLHHIIIILYIIIIYHFVISRILFKLKSWYGLAQWKWIEIFIQGRSNSLEGRCAKLLGGAFVIVLQKNMLLI